MNVGHTTRRWTDPERTRWSGAGERPLVTDLWYPAADDADEQEMLIGPRSAPVFRAGRAAPDAELSRAAERWPVLLLSHGTGGSARQLGWIAGALAAAGCVVAGVNHHGNTSIETYVPQGFCLWWERTRDLRVVLDRLLADETFGARVDVARVGAMGFSLGGYTIFSLAGARTALDAYREFCRGRERDATCRDVPEFPGMIERFRNIEKTDPIVAASLERHGASYRDDRVRAFFTVAPVLPHAFAAGELESLAQPVAIVVGDADDIAAPATNADVYAARVPGASLHVLPGGVGHYTFMALCTERGAETLPTFCVERPGVDRAAVHEETVGIARAFFEKNLATERGDRQTFAEGR